MSKDYKKLKIRTALLSVVSNSILIVIKVIAGVLTGSVSIISEAIHSALDLVAAAIAFFAVRVSDKPADIEHPFGHGKYENISGVVEALLIFAAAIWIIFEALDKLIHVGHLAPTNSLTIGIIVMLFSGVVNFFISRRLYKVAKLTDSIALEADALHLKTDVYTSVGVGLGLLLIKLTGYYFLDPIIALLVALFIISEAYSMLIKSVNPLLDGALSDDELKKVIGVIESKIMPDTEYNNLRTRKSGSKLIVQFSFLVDGNMKVDDALVLRNKLNDDINSKFNNIELIIVLEDRKEKKL